MSKQTKQAEQRLSAQELVTLYIQAPEVSQEEAMKCAALIVTMIEIPVGLPLGLPLHPLLSNEQAQQVRRMAAMYFAGKRDGIALAKEQFDSAIARL